MPSLSRAFLIVAFLVVFENPSTSQAQRNPPPAKSSAAAGLALEEIAVMLASSDIDEVRAALEAAAEAPRSALTTLLVERVRAGLPADLVIVALDAVALAQEPEATALLLELTQHRRGEVRARALLAVATRSSPEAEATLVRGLSDVEASVRSAAATGLGLLGTSNALPSLIRAAVREVEGADRAIVQHADAASVAELTRQLPELPLSRMTPLLDGLLLKRELPDEAKVKLLERIAALDSIDGQAYLEGFVVKLPQDASPRVKQALASFTAPRTP